MVSSLPERPPATPPPSRKDQFLSRVLDYALSSEWRTPKDYFDHFGTRTVVEKLEQDSALRTRLLVETTGVHERLARRKSPESATEDLDIALEQGLTTAQQLIALIPNDDRVRYLDAREVWRFLVGEAPSGAEGEAPSGAGGEAVTVERVTFLLRAAVDCGLLSLREITHAMGLHRVSTSLPQAELQRILETALERAQEGHRLSEEEILGAIPLDVLVQYVPLEHTWTEVVEGALLNNAGLGKGGGRASAPPEEPPAPEEAAPVDNRAEMGRVCEALRALGRLPDDSEALGLPVLHSIESMYAELQQTVDEQQRHVVVREAFPNDSLLRAGVISLLRMLDPELSRKGLESASTEVLAETLLHLEQRITDSHQAGGEPPAGETR